MATAHRLVSGYRREHTAFPVPVPPPCRVLSRPVSRWRPVVGAGIVVVCLAGLVACLYPEPVQGAWGIVAVCVTAAGVLAGLAVAGCWRLGR